jgi:hypothetical protein
MLFRYVETLDIEEDDHSNFVFGHVVKSIRQGGRIFTENLMKAIAAVKNIRVQETDAIS